MPEEGLRRGRRQQTSGIPQSQGDCQVMVLQADGQPGRDGWRHLPWPRGTTGRGHKELLD